MVAMTPGILTRQIDSFLRFFRRVTLQCLLDLADEVNNISGAIKKVTVLFKLGEVHRDDGLAGTQILIELHRIGGFCEGVDQERNAGNIERLQVGRQLSVRLLAK